MTPESAADALPLSEKQIVSTAGLTTKVIKGSMWTLAGQVAPMLLAFVTTPFTIKFLGPEGYGVLILVGLIPAYFNFADFGMVTASIRFASEAHGDSNTRNESAIVWTAATIGTLSMFVIVVPIIVFAESLVTIFNVPENFHSAAVMALRISTVSFYVGILSSIFASPMVARLRMDLNTVIASVPKLMVAIGTPLILFYGGGVVGAVLGAMIVGFVALIGAFSLSARLLPELTSPRFDSAIARSLLKFGLGWFAAVVAAALLSNLEKLMLPKLISVESLAFYSVAFTLGSTATMAVMAMTQTLVPAFSQLQSDDKREQFEALFSRTVRLNLMWLPPMIVLLFVIAGPFFYYWLGSDFERESTTPFYILLAGLLFTLIAYIPSTAITAAGRTDVLAKLFAIELVPFALITYVLISNFGILGAAAASSIRVIADGFAIIYLAKRITGVRFSFKLHFLKLGIAALILLPIVLIVLTEGNYSVWIIPTVAVCLGIYLWFLLRFIIDQDERRWITDRIAMLTNR